MRNILFKVRLPLFTIFFLLVTGKLQCQRISIIESTSSGGLWIMDSVWLTAATEAGYDATIVQQSALDSLDSLANTDVLIVSAAEDSYFQTDHLQTIIDFVKSGRPAYIQSEYLTAYQGDITFATLMDSLGENFKWTGTVNGDLAPMIILPPFSQYPDTVSAIEYFNYGQTGSGYPHIDTFLQYQGQYFGFYYHDSTSCNGAVITESDEDWIWMLYCPQLITNMLYQLVHSVNCYSAVALQASATVNYPHCDSACTAEASVTAAHGNPPYRYRWSLGNDTTSAVNNLCNGSYTVTITDSLGNSVIDSVSIVIPQSAAVTITATDTVFCQGDSVSICAPAGLISYNWNDGQTTNCIEARQPATFYLTAIDQNNCVSNSDTVSITVYPINPASISQMGDTLYASPGTSYQWFLNGTMTTTSPIDIAQTPGQYTVAVTDSNGCVSISNPVVISGLMNIALLNVNIAPNPTHDSWQLSVPAELIGSKVEIFDETGQLIYNAVIINEAFIISIVR